MTLLQKIGVFFGAKHDELKSFLSRAKVVYEKIRFTDRFEREQIDLRAKCPACGHGGKRGWLFRRYEPDVAPHKIKFSKVHQAVIHECPVCTAPWGEKCLVKPKDWKVQLDGDEPTPDADGTITIQQIAEG